MTFTILAGANAFITSRSLLPNIFPQYIFCKIKIEVEKFISVTLQLRKSIFLSWR